MNNLVVDHCIFTSTIASGAVNHQGKQVNLNGCQYYTISNNQFYSAPNNDLACGYAANAFDGYGKIFGNNFYCGSVSTSGLIPAQNHVEIYENGIYGVLLEAGPIYSSSGGIATVELNVHHNTFTSTNISGFASGCQLSCYQQSSVHHNTLYDCGIGVGPNYGVNIPACNINISDNILIATTNSIVINTGIGIAGLDGNYGYNNTVHNNIIYSMGNSPQNSEMMGIYDCEFTSLTGNRIYNCNNRTIEVSSSSQPLRGIIVNDNTIVNTGYVNSGDCEAVSFQGTIGGTFSGNKINDTRAAPSSTGVVLYYDRQLTVTNNEFNVWNFSYFSPITDRDDVSVISNIKRYGNYSFYIPLEPGQQSGTYSSPPSSKTWHKNTVV